MRTVAAVLALSMATLGCTVKDYVRVRPGPTGQACVAECAAGEGPNARLDCYNACPGVTISRLDSCTPAEEPKTICLESRRLSANLTMGFLVLVSTLGMLLLLGPARDPDSR